MKLFTLLIYLSLNFRFVLTFGSVGKDERLFFYYGYLLDVEINKGKANSPQSATRNIAPGCGASTSSGKSHVCTFNEFIKYIWGGNEPPLAGDFNAQVNEKYYPTVDDLVPGDDHGTGGAYKPNLIINGLSYNDLVKLFEKVSTFTQLTIDQVKDDDAKAELKTGLWKAVQGVARGRQENKVSNLMAKFNHQPDPKTGATGWEWTDDAGKRHDTKFIFATKEIPLYEGAPTGDVVQEIDLPQSRLNNPHVSKEEFKGAMKDQLKHDADNHTPNIRAAREACSMLKNSCI